jgi:hypothetical protein
MSRFSEKVSTNNYQPTEFAATVTFLKFVQLFFKHVQFKGLVGSSSADI